MEVKKSAFHFSAIVISVVTTISCNSSSSNHSATDSSSTASSTLTAVEARTLARDAYLFGLPLVFMEKQSDYQSYATKVEKRKAPVNQFLHYRAFVDASDRSVVGFNVDNLYSFASLDLTKEPIILSIPEMGKRFWLMQLIDAWNGVPAAPGSRSRAGKGGNFAIMGPGWQGQLPTGVEELKCPTNLVLIGGRTYCSGPADYAAVHKLQDQYKLTPLSQWGKNYTPPTHVPLKAGATDSVLVNKQFVALSAEQYYQNLNRLMVNNPPYPADSLILRNIEKIGVKPGANFSLTSFDPSIAKAIEEGYADGYKVMMEEATHLGKIENGWSLTYDMGKYGTRYTYRAAWTFFGVGGNILEDAFYPLAQMDADKNPLDGANQYILTFTKDQIPPAEAFWSLTMYDSDAYLVPNKLNRYSLGDRSKMKYGRDSSLVIYMQNSSPGKDKESNWLPTPRHGKLKVALRLYVPKKQVIDGTWIPPAIQKVK